MLRKPLALFVILLGTSFQTNAGTEALPPVTEWLPPDTAVVIEVRRPKALLDALLSAEMAKTVSAEARGPQSLKLQQLQGLVAYLETQAGTDWRSAVRQLVEHGLTVAIEPGGGMLVCFDAQDEKLLPKLHDMFRNIAIGEAAKQGQPERVGSAEYRGTTTWSFNTNEAHAMLRERGLVANQGSLLKETLDLRAKRGQPSLASSPLYQAARKNFGPDAVATVYLNFEVVRRSPKIKQALAGDSNPLGALLLADAKAALLNAHWLGAELSLADNRLTLNLTTDGQAPEKACGFLSPGSGAASVLPNLTVLDCIASVSLYRDLRAFYAAKDDLFPERTSGLVFFENMMGIFFSGIELTEGVLAETKPDIRVVVARQHYDPVVGTPAVQVPAFAAVLRLNHPEQFGEIVEEAWQKAIGLANFTRGQQALPGLIIDRATHAGVRYTLSYYRPPKEASKDPIDTRYNFRPSLARTGNYVILSSTDELAESLIDAVKREDVAAPKAATGTHSFAEISGPQLNALLLANREHLVRNNMVEKGNTREQAETEIGVLATLVNCVDRASLSLRQEDHRPKASLELKLKYPDHKSDKTAAMR